MKVKIEFTVEVNADDVRLLQESLAATDEDMREFVRSYIISGGIGSLEESLANNGFDNNIVREV